MVYTLRFFLFKMQFFHTYYVFGSCIIHILYTFNRLKPNDHYSGRTAPLTSKRCILYIYSTNIGTTYFKMVYTLRIFLFKMQFVS